MLSSGERLLDFLGDSNLTAKFQQLCGIRSHEPVRPPCTCAHVAGEERTAGKCLKPDVPPATNSCPYNCAVSVMKQDLNGHNDNNSDSLNHYNSLSNGFSKDGHLVHRTNGYRNGFSPLHQFTKILTDHKDVSPIQHFSGNGTDSKTNPHANGQKNGVCVPTYTIGNFFFYYMFVFGAGLGNELFYIVFFSSTLWNFDSLVIRKLLIVWCVIMYMGQAAKDIIRWPRPKSPPVVRLEERYELEYGMPSTHAMVGVTIPFGIIIFMSGRYEFNYFIGITFAIIWSLLVSLSRLYLGMHSVLDIIAGLICAVTLMSVTFLVVDPVDNFLMSHSMAIPVTIIICIGLCLLYPSLEQWSTARGDTTLVLGVFSGIYAGMWLTGKLTHFEHPQHSPPYVLDFPSLEDICVGLLRQIVGLVIIVIFLTIVKMAILHSLSWLFGRDPEDPQTKQHKQVELPYKYISYYISALASTYFIPLLFLKFNIERLSYYTEIFNR